MKTLLILLFTLVIGPPLWAQGTKPAPATTPARVTVMVHPGIELFTVVQLLAGQYPMPNPSAYATDAQTYFAPFANHPAVQHVKKMGRVYSDLPELGYCFDNFPAIRAYYPDSLNWYSMYGKDTVQTYMRLCQQFYQDTHFWDFYQQHQAAYTAWAGPVQTELVRQGLVAKLDSFYRFAGDARWVVCLDPLNSWGAHTIMTKQINPRYAGQIVYNVGYFERKSKATDPPAFTIGSESVNMVWHEGSHSITHDLQKKYQADIAKLAYLLNEKDEGMKRNNIKTWAHAFDENLVRGIVIALFRQHRIPQEARKQAAREIVGDFLYAGDIADVLTKEYVGNPVYRDFNAFFPRIMTYLAAQYPAAPLLQK